MCSVLGRNKNLCPDFFYIVTRPFVTDFPLKHKSRQVSPLASKGNSHACAGRRGKGKAEGDSTHEVCRRHSHQLRRRNRTPMTSPPPATVLAHTAPASPCTRPRPLAAAPSDRDAEPTDTNTNLEIHPPFAKTITKCPKGRERGHPSQTWQTCMSR